MENSTSKTKNKRVEKPRPERIGPAYVKQFRVKEKTGLLEFLLANMTGASRNNIKGLLTRRQVAVDGAPVAQFDFEVYPGDIVMIGATRLANRKKKTDIAIIYEDAEIIVINKPSGLLSIASDKEKATTAYRQVTDHVREMDAHARVFVVHRIDQDTSGVLMFCKNEALRNAWQEKWNDLVTKRAYYALVAGVPAKSEDTLRHYLKETTTHLVYVSDKHGDGQLAITKYQVVKSNAQYALLDVTIDSGRKNQIRVQLRHIGHPVVGDDKYDTLLNPLGRLGLHAYELALKHPLMDKTYEFKAPLPKPFLDLFNAKETIKPTPKPTRPKRR